MNCDIFLSYPHADVAPVKRIVEGLARSKALVAWYFASYVRSRACQWELTAAFLAA